jgi:hypothetical protein
MLSSLHVEYKFAKIAFPNMNFCLKMTVLAMILILTSLNSGHCQDEVSGNLTHFRGNISITNNGLSLIPAFSLNRPAAIFELSVGGERLSFDPEMRFALDGQPWSFILWWRYKLIKSDKFKLHVGAHPAYIFENIMVEDDNGNMVETMKTNRFFAGEISPSYNFNENNKVTFLYLQGRSLGSGPLAINQFVALGTSHTNLSITKKFFLNAKPQLFYLKMNEKDGYFASGSFLIGKKNFPISLGSIISKKIISEIEVDNWIWNISLVYSFNNEFVKRSNPIL